jgi:4'-phosphopantetheinyl transferase
MPELAAGEVHVWWASVDETAPPLEELASTLSTDEQERAARFVFDRHRRRFQAARGLLRAILSRYTGRPPGALRFEYGAKGKPSLVDGGDLRFNVSHSDGMAAYALTRGREIGVDIERIRPLDDPDVIARHFFSAPEQEALRALAPGRKLEGFYTCWTRKEAYVKARGEGLGHPLDRFAVALTPPGPVCLLAAGGADEYDVGRWSLFGLAQHGDYVAALGVEGHGWSLSSAWWPEPS